jgi:hypothetical protein
METVTRIAALNTFLLCAREAVHKANTDTNLIVHVVMGTLETILLSPPPPPPTHTHIQNALTSSFLPFFHLSQTGNEASDLDSMVSSCLLAFLRSLDPLPSSAASSTEIYVPVMNIPRQDLSLRTEAVWLFAKAKYYIQKENITPLPFFFHAHRLAWTQMYCCLLMRLTYKSSL